MVMMLVLVLVLIVPRQRPISSLGAQQVGMRRSRCRRHSRLGFGLHASVHAETARLVSAADVWGWGCECSPVTRRRCPGYRCCPSRDVGGNACGDSRAGTGWVQGGTRSRPVVGADVLRWIRSGRACVSVCRRPRGAWASQSPGVGNKSEAAVGTDGELQMASFHASVWRVERGERDTYKRTRWIRRRVRGIGVCAPLFDDVFCFRPAGMATFLVPMLVSRAIRPGGLTPTPRSAGVNLVAQRTPGTFVYQIILRDMSRSAGCDRGCVSMRNRWRNGRLISIIARPDRRRHWGRRLLRSTSPSLGFGCNRTG